jgi:hypothetical protein
MEDLRYPIGKFNPDPKPEAAKRLGWIDEIAELPDRLRAVLSGLTEEQLDTPYRPDGWTVRQLVHHLADSHVSAYTRFRLTLTEEVPLVKTYEQDGWAGLRDARSAPVELSIQLLSALHGRWVLLLRSLDEEDLRRKFRHPEWGEVDLETTLQMYAWHGRHHLAHLTGLVARKGWRRK